MNNPFGDSPPSANNETTFNPPNNVSPPDPNQTQASDSNQAPDNFQNNQTPQPQNNQTPQPQNNQIPEQQNPFSNGNTTFSNNNQQNFNQSSNKPKYNIIDMYWFINMRLYNNQQLEGENTLLSLAFNGDFQNLRCTFIDANDGAFTNSSIVLSNTKRVTTVNLYSETCHQILNTFKNIDSLPEEGKQITSFERIIQQSSNWTPSQSFILIKKEETILTASNPNRTCKFTFSGWQVEAFKNACQFMISGNSWKLGMSCLLNK